MRLLLALTLAAGAFTPVPAAFAEEHTVHETIAIAAPAAAVWKQVRDFGGLSAWLPSIASSEIVVGENNVVGAVRLLTLPDGGQVREELLAHDDATHSLSYSILEAPLPVKDYRSTITVRKAGEGTEVEWNGSFDAGPEMVEVFTGIYRGGLENLKSMLEHH